MLVAPASNLQIVVGPIVVVVVVYLFNGVNHGAFSGIHEHIYLIPRGACVSRQGTTVAVSALGFGERCNPTSC